jgi:hypothetical protein
VDTPSGPIPVQAIRVGMLIWSADVRGDRIRAIVLRTGRSVASIGHEMVVLTLADGRTIQASPGHPTFDGGRVGEARRGDRLDGSEVLSSRLVAYRGAFTYDLLASGPTGAYFADGVLLGSTLAPARAAVLHSGRVR